MTPAAGAVKTGRLDAAGAAAFLPELSAYFRPVLRRLRGDGDERYVAVGAWEGDVPAGLLLFRRRRSGETAVIETLWCAREARPERVAPPLLEAMRRELEALGCRRMEIPESAVREHHGRLPPVLLALGYRPVDWWCGELAIRSLEAAPWHRWLKLPGAFEVATWDQTTPQERAWMRERGALERRDDLDEPIVPATSLVMRAGSRIEGWLIARRVAGDVVLYETMEMPEKWQRLGLGLGLIVEALRRQVATPPPRPRLVRVEIDMDDERYIDLFERRFLAYCPRIRVSHAREYVAYPGAAGPAPRPVRTRWHRAYSQHSAFQHIDVQRDRRGFRLVLDGHLQFHSWDEYRYHEALVHPALLAHPNPRRVLVLGGGDGLALREIWRHPGVERVVLVDIDPAMTRLHRRFLPLAELAENALEDARVEVVNEDAAAWLAAPHQERFDAAIVDLPDPSDEALAALYTVELFCDLTARLEHPGTLTIQSTSLGLKRKAYWCIGRTLEAAGLQVRRYQVATPVFGLVGFHLAAKEAPAGPPRCRGALPAELRFLTHDALEALFSLGLDLGTAPEPVRVNRRGDLVLAQYYDE